MIPTVRDPEGWYRSFAATIAPFLTFADSHPDPHMNAVVGMARDTIHGRVFGGRADNRDHCIRVFSDHVAEVEATIAPERLLRFDVREGWGRLCVFLGVAVPDEAFPRANSARGFPDDTGAGTA